MSLLRYISHPGVAIDPTIPVPQWGLSGEGRKQASAMLDQPWVASIDRIVSSNETKALETAAVLADHLDLEVEVRPATGENDRSATGFVPPDEFQQLADAFFAEPEVSVRGWERAIDAQRRIVAGLSDLFQADGVDTAIVGHGGVGTLWYCHLIGKPIDRNYDQPGQGHYFTVDTDTQDAVHSWRPIDQID